MAIEINLGELHKPGVIEAAKWALGQHAAMHHDCDNAIYHECERGFASCRSNCERWCKKRGKWVRRNG